MVLRDESGTEIHVGVLIHQRGIRRNLVAAHRHQAHRLGAAGHDGRCEPTHHALRGVGDGLQTGRAEAIHRHGGGGHRDAGTQAGNPRDVHPLFRFGHRTSQNHVVHIGGIDVPGAAQRFGDDRRGEIVRARAAKRPRARLADGGARGRYDNGVFHKMSQSQGYGRTEVLRYNSLSSSAVSASIVVQLTS